MESMSVMRKDGEVGMNCENCGWSEIVGAPIICYYNERRTWRDGCCEAWKPKKEKETNMVEVVRCKDCKHATMTSDGKMCKYCAMDTDDSGNQRDVYHDADWFCADGERKESW